MRFQRIGTQKEGTSCNKANNEQQQRAGEQDKARAFDRRLQAFAQFLDVAPKGQLSTAGEPGTAGESP